MWYYKMLFVLCALCFVIIIAGLNVTLRQLCKAQGTRHKALALLLLLSACGFHPMYGKHSVFGSNTPLSGNLLVEPISGRDGQIFKIKLEDILNPESRKNASPEYHLQVKLTKTLVPAVIKSDGTVQRYDIQITSAFTLLKSGKSVLAGTLQRIGSYNVAINANFATYEAGQDVTERTLQELAEDHALRLSGYFSLKHDTTNSPR